MIEIKDMPKLECPFVRKKINNRYLAIDKINPGYEWVFEDESVMAIEKLHGTNVSILIEGGTITGIWHREERIPFFNKGKKFIVEGLLESFDKNYISPLLDGQHFGELIGPDLNDNPYDLSKHLWIPFSTYAKKHLRYGSWGKYPKNFNTISEWFKELMPLFGLNRGNGSVFVEGIVFTHPDGRMAKVRKDMFEWFGGKRH